MKKLIVALSMLILFVLFNMNSAFAEGENSDLQKKPREVELGIYILNIGKLDITSGTFNVDFYLTIKDTKPIKDNSFEVMNGKVVKIDTYDDWFEDGKYVKYYRIVSTQTMKTDLRKFPFDKQTLPIVIENTEETSSLVKYVSIPGETGIDKENSFPGWIINGWSTKVLDHNYSIFGENYSQFNFNVDISKIWFNSFIKTFLPVLFTVFITLVIFVISYDKVTTRLEITSSLLVAIAMFHTSIYNQLPPVNYTTVADQFMFLTYFVLLLCICIHIYVYRLLIRKNDNVESFDKYAKYSLSVLVPIAYMAFFLFFI